MLHLIAWPSGAAPRANAMKRVLGLLFVILLSIGGTYAGNDQGNGAKAEEGLTQEHAAD